MKNLKGAKLLNITSQKTIHGGTRNPGCMSQTLSPGPNGIATGDGNRPCYCTGEYMGVTTSLMECCILCEFG